DLEFYYLDDNAATPTSVDWATYRDQLTWKPWGKRPTAPNGIIGDQAEFTDTYNTEDSSSIYFLRGKYSGIAPATGYNLTNDYIVDSTDALLGNNYPLFQYTWIAIQTRNADSGNCLRFGCSNGLSPSVSVTPVEA